VLLLDQPDVVLPVVAHLGALEAASVNGGDGLLVARFETAIAESPVVGPNDYFVPISLSTPASG
jgi:hypothetical protein